MTLHGFCPRKGKFVEDEILQIDLVRILEYLVSFRLESFDVF